jgi:hypothetical protein
LRRGDEDVRRGGEDARRIMSRAVPLKCLSISAISCQRGKRYAAFVETSVGQTPNVHRIILVSYYTSYNFSRFAQ